MSERFRQELELLIRARYPILYVLTSEEGRVLRVLAEIAHRWQKKIFEWSCTTGILASGTPIQSQKYRNSPSRDPVVALDTVLDHVDPAIFVFKDFHPFLTKGNFVVIRRLKELAQHLKHSRKTLVILAPVLEIPVELEKDITVLTHPLPDVEELGMLLDEIVADVSQLKGITVEIAPEDREQLLKAALGLTLGEAENVFAKILVRQGRLSGEDVNEVYAEKKQIIRKNGLLEYYESTETIEDIGGLAVLKDWLIKRGMAFTDRAREFGLPHPKGVLLLGVQGCGKSLCAKVVANLWHLPLLRFDVGRIFGSLVGSSEENIRRAIAVAESVAPAVLWIDEIDKAFAGAQGSAVSDAGTSARVFGTFLTWLSEKTSPVFVVATANEISHLPPELLRKGRFDEIFFIDLPTPEERAEIFRIHIRKRGRNPAAFDIPALVEKSAEFSGAEIEQAVVSALYEAFYLGQELTTDLILRVLEQSVPLSHTVQEQIVRLRDWSRGRARNASIPVPVKSKSNS